MTSSGDELDLVELFQTLFPDLSLTQNQLDNPTTEIVSALYQQVRNKIYYLVSDAVKDVEPDEAKRTDDTVYSLVRFINFTTQYVFPNIDASMTFKLLHVPTGKWFKLHIKPLLRVLWSFEKEFTKVKDILSDRCVDSKELQSKRTELDDCKKTLANNISEIAANESKYAELQKSREKVQIRFRKLTQLQDEGKNTSEKLKEELKSILEEHDNKQVLVENIKANIQHLSKQVVTEDSYKALLSLKNNVNVICTELKCEENNIQENLRGKSIDIESFTNTKGQLIQLTKYGKELSSMREHYSKNLSKRMSLHNEVEELRDEVQKLNCSSVQLKENIKICKDVIQKANVKKSDCVEKYEQDLFNHKETLMLEQENQERILNRKLNLEKTRSGLSESCAKIKCEIENLNVFHNQLYQKFINIENANTENMSNALSDILDVLRSAQ